MDNQVENQMQISKKGTGKNILIIILIIVLFGALGHIAYDKIIVKESKKTSIKSEIKKEKEVGKENCDVSVNPLESLVGIWTYKSSYNMGDGNSCDINVKLDMKADGTYEYENTATCGGGTIAKGTYALGINKIYLHNDNCVPVINGTGSDECTYPNCQPVIEIDYKDNKIMTTVIGGRVVNIELNN